VKAMKGHPCCEIGRANGKRRPPILSRLLEATEWLIPSLILAILPKCPLCIVAYVAIGTGLGLSVSTATSIRIFLITACFGSLIYLAVRSLIRIYQSHSWTGRIHG